MIQNNENQVSPTPPPNSISASAYFMVLTPKGKGVLMRPVLSENLLSLASTITQAEADMEFGGVGVGLT